MTKNKAIRALLPKTGGILLALAIVLGTLSWLKPEPLASPPPPQTTSQVRVYELEGAETEAWQDEEKPDKPPRKRRGRHHGPPPPPGVPPTVLFLIGGALGYLIGSQRRGPRFPPPPPPPCHRDKAT